MYKDLFSGLSMLAFAALFYAGAVRIGDSGMADPVGPAGLPKLLALALAFFSALLVLKALLSIVKHRPAVSAPVPARAEARARHLIAAGMLGIGIGYAALAETIGYVLAIGLVIALTALYLGARTWRVPVLAIAGAFFFWLLFVQVLSIDQPAGVWTGFGIGK